MNNSITIIGMTASGKSTLGKKLAKRLKYDFKDLDNEVEKEIGLEIHEMYNYYTIKKITNFFISKYEELYKSKNTIISTGGSFGVVYNFKNMKNILFLDISYDLFLKRINEAKKNMNAKENKNRRIIFQPTSKVKEDYIKRHPKYLKQATHNYKVSNLNDLQNIEDEIVRNFQPKIEILNSFEPNI